jgi:nitrogen fixation protein FixH
MSIELQHSVGKKVQILNEVHILNFLLAFFLVVAYSIIFHPLAFYVFSWLDIGSQYIASLCSVITSIYYVTHYLDLL